LFDLCALVWLINVYMSSYHRALSASDMPESKEMKLWLNMSSWKWAQVFIFWHLV
jgi:hypothetical protein